MHAEGPTQQNQLCKVLKKSPN